MVTFVPSQFGTITNACRLAGIPVGIVGMRGAGKTTCAKAYAAWVRDQMEKREKGSGAKFGFKHYNLASSDPVEMIGVLMPNDEDRTSEFYTRSDFPFDGNPRVEDSGILFYDEINWMRRQMESVLLNIFDDSRTIGGRPIKRGWWPMCAMNPSSELTGAGCLELSMPMRRRICWCYMVTTVSEVSRYGKEQGWDNDAIALMEAKGESLISGSPAFEDMAVETLDDGTSGKPVPDQIRYYSRIATLCNKYPEVFGPVRFHLMQGVLGLATAAEEAHRLATYGKCPTITEVCNGTTLVPDSAHQHHIAVTFALMGSAVHNGDAKQCEHYLELCLNSGMSPELVRLGIVCLSRVRPEVWGKSWALQFA